MPLLRLGRRNMARFQKVIVLTLFAVLTARPSIPQGQQETLTNADVMRRVKSGIAEQTIILMIKNQSAQFDTSPQAIIDLKVAGVPDGVLNAMVETSPHPAAKQEPRKDCATLLDQILANIGTPATLSAIRSIRLVGQSTVRRSSGTTTVQIERIVVYPGSLYVATQSGGLVSKIVLTPEFNYSASGKMTTAVPSSVVDEFQASMKLDPVHIVQHREHYTCTLGANEQVGGITTSKLTVSGEGAEGYWNFEPTTLRVLRIALAEPSGEYQVSDLSDWRQIDGLTIPFKRHVVKGAITTDLIVSECQVNPTLDSNLFRPLTDQPTAAISFKVLQSESVPYTVQTNGGISTSCNISGSANGTLTASTYGNTTYGTVNGTQNVRMNCISSDNTIRWRHVLNAMLVQASDGNAYIIACDRAWRWSKCTPLKAGDVFLARRTDKGFVVQSFNSKSKEQEATYGVLQSKLLKRLA